MSGNLAEDRSRLWTYGEYLAWDSDQRWELIHGRAYLMAQPSPEHQRINKLLIKEMDRYFENKPCEAYLPLDVRLFPKDDNSDYVNVQPDISVICNPEQLDERGCRGAPTLVVEIISPSTASRDYTDKMELYRDSGVQEYWIVDPFGRIVNVYLLQARHEKRKSYNIDDILTSKTFPGLDIPLSDIFPNE